MNYIFSLFSDTVHYSNVMPKCKKVIEIIKYDVLAEINFDILVEIETERPIYLSLSVHIIFCKRTIFALQPLF